MCSVSRFIKFLRLKVFKDTIELVIILEEILGILRRDLSIKADYQRFQEGAKWQKQCSMLLFEQFDLPYFVTLARILRPVNSRTSRHWSQMAGIAAKACVGNDAERLQTEGC